MSKEDRMAAMDAYEKAPKKYKVNLKKSKKDTEISEYKPPMYPTLHLSDVKLPIDAKSVGKSMKVMVTMKLTDYGESTTAKGEDCRYTFEIQKMEF